jgi:hypothetical protein
MTLKWNQTSGKSDKRGIFLSHSITYVKGGITQDCLEIHHQPKWGCMVTSPVVSGEYLSEYAIQNDSLTLGHGIGDYSTFLTGYLMSFIPINSWKELSYLGFLGELSAAPKSF